MPGVTPDNMVDEEKDPEVLIPEVLPPEKDAHDRPPRPPRPDRAQRAQRAFGPIVAGAIIDAVDFATAGPAGLILGFMAGFWVGSIFRLPAWQRVILGLLAGWYCLMPFLRFVPLATLVGAYVQFRESP